MLHSRAAIFLAAAIAFATACSQTSVNPTTTTTTTTTPPTTVTTVTVTGSGMQVNQTSQMTAIATLSNSSTQNVTSTAAWQSSNTAVATVNSNGLVTGVGAGAATITATYLTIRGTVTLVVTAAPTASTLTGLITDGTSGGILPGIRVGVTNGPNADKSVKTDSTGRYSLPGIVAGTMTLQASADSYQSVEKTITVNGDLRTDFVLPRTPPPPPPPPGTPPWICSGAGCTTITFATDSTTCKCWDPTITLKINGYAAGSMSCSGSLAVTVKPGTWTASACDSTGCLSKDTTVAVGISAVITEKCSAALTLDGSGKVVDCVTTP